MSESKKEKKRKKDTVVSDSVTPTASIAWISEPTLISDEASLSPPATPAEVSAFLEKHSITISTPDSTAPLVPVLAFTQLDVLPELQVSFKGFKEPSPIQACAWPPALKGLDVVGIAETGR